MAEDTQDGAAGQRREEARGRTRKRQNEGYRKQAEARSQKKKSPPRLRAPPLTVMENGERAVRARLQKSPRSPPNAFASPWHNRSFSPSCPRRYNRTSILPTYNCTYLFRLSYELTSHMLHRILLSSDWTTHSSSPTSCA